MTSLSSTIVRLQRSKAAVVLVVLLAVGRWFRRWFGWVWLKRHRFICTGCGFVWDRRFALLSWEFVFILEGLRYDYMKHYLTRTRQQKASDGWRGVREVCGQIEYEGYRE